jgi:hypothetical protein
MESKMKYRILKGRRGSWQIPVSWDNGTTQILPCVHLAFCKFDKGGSRYHDPLQWEEGSPEDALHHWRMVDQLRLLEETRRVIVTTDYNPENKQGLGAFKRSGYVGAYDIDNIIVDTASGIRFDIVRRYCEQQ